MVLTCDTLVLDLLSQFDFFQSSVGRRQISELAAAFRVDEFNCVHWRQKLIGRLFICRKFEQLFDPRIELAFITKVMLVVAEADLVFEGGAKIDQSLRELLRHRVEEFIRAIAQPKHGKTDVAEAS